MKKILASALLFICPPGLLITQIDAKLKEDIRNTGYVHSPLPLDYGKSFESFDLTKKVLTSDIVCDMEDLNDWSYKGIGGMTLTTERSKSGKHSMRLVAPSTYPQFLGWGLG